MLLCAANLQVQAQTPYVHIDAESPTYLEYEVSARPNGWYHALRDIAIGPDRDMPADGDYVAAWISGTMSYTGGRSIGLRAYPSVGPNRDRIEIRAVHGDNDGFRLANATTRYFGYAFMLHNQTQAPIGTSDAHIMQVWQRPSGSVQQGKVPFTLSLGNDYRLHAKARTHVGTWNIWHSEPVSKGEWHTLVYELRPSYNGDSQSGTIAIWFDGVEVTRWVGDWGNPPSLGYTEYFDVRCGIYRSAQNTHTIIMYDDVRFGLTRESVTP
ncbi:heparin lyase I family protein [Marilutibacter maris]|uniref:heparin lyase I family protein n=1 Tax=Marilutibacter maris TaxID=1605891 RepID=UPI0014797334|nr:heparin lyase I family protein [Lysobacter maris]